MYVVVSCPQCHTQLRARPESAGRTIRCWACRAEAAVPAAELAPDPALRWGRSLRYPLQHQGLALLAAVAIALGCVAVPAVGLNGLLMAAGLVVTLTILGVRRADGRDGSALAPRSWLRCAEAALMAGGVIVAGLGPRTVKAIAAYNRQQPVPPWVNEVLVAWLVLCLLIAPAVWLTVATWGWPWAANPWAVGRTLRRIGRGYGTVLLVMIGAVVVTELILLGICLTFDVLTSREVSEPTWAARWGSTGLPLLAWWHAVRRGQLLLWDLPIWYSDALASRSFLRVGYIIAQEDASLLVGMLLIVLVTASIGAYTWAVVIHRLDLLSRINGPGPGKAGLPGS